MEDGTRKLDRRRCTPGAGASRSVPGRTSLGAGSRSPASARVTNPNQHALGILEDEFVGCPREPDLERSDAKRVPPPELLFGLGMSRGRLRFRQDPMGPVAVQCGQCRSERLLRSRIPTYPEILWRDYEELHGALDEGRGFLGDSVPLRLASVTLLCTPGEPEALATRLRAVDQALAERLGWFSGLSSSTRLLMAALLVKYGDEPGVFLDEVARVRAMMRDVGLRRGGSYEFLAVLVLRRGRDGRDLDADLDRFEHHQHVA